LPVGRRRVLFTDLDGTLLDHDSYRPGPARAALDRLRTQGVWVVPVTSKTAAELALLAQDLDLRDGWIVENGGALQPAGATEAVIFGVPYARLRAALAAAAGAAGAVVRGFGDMDELEVAQLTGLTATAAAAARRREWSESFLLVHGELPRLRFELHRRGLQVFRGGRFLTATGRHDKGTAVRAMLARTPAMSWAVGDAANDAPMLAAVDHPFQVRRPDGAWTDLAVADVTRVDGIGPHGFVQVAERLLR
jgi:mannosyl-3-phosphoglycerate phosphatase